MPFRHNSWALLGTGIHHGQPKSGVERAYDLLSTEGVFTMLKGLGHDIQNYGDLADEKTDTPYLRLYEKMKTIIPNPQIPLLIGGDHSQAFASISALVDAYPDLKVIWVDAHGDINTPASSPTGNLHGMPLAGLLGIVDKTEFEMPWLNQKLKPENVALIGIRDLDKMEMNWIQKLGVLNFTAKDVKEKGMAQILQILSKTWGSEGPVHISFDIDGLDSSLVPATGTPVGDGIDLDSAKILLDLSKAFFDICSCEIVELNPSIANSPFELETTLATVTEILKSLMNKA